MKKYKILDNNMRKEILTNAKKLVRQRGTCIRISCGKCPITYFRENCSGMEKVTIAKEILVFNKKSK